MLSMIWLALISPFQDVPKQGPCQYGAIYCQMYSAADGLNITESSADGLLWNLIECAKDGTDIDGDYFRPEYWYEENNKDDDDDDDWGFGSSDTTTTTTCAPKALPGVPGLVMAAKYGNEELVNQFLNLQADPNITDFLNETPLVKAVERGNASIVSSLVSHGADVNTVYTDGTAVLVQATNYGDEKTVNILLDNNADVNSQDYDGDTALIRAATYGHTKIAKKLLDLGADFTHEGSFWAHTALHLASYYGFEAIIDDLLNHGADVNYKNENNETALYKAACGGHLKLNFMIWDQKSIYQKNLETQQCLMLPVRDILML